MNERCAIQRNPPRTAITMLFIALVALIFATTYAAEKKTAPEAKLSSDSVRKIDFAKDIQPLFATHCISCHGAEKKKSDYRLDLKKSAFTGGSIGGAIVPGSSKDSKLIAYVAGLDEDVVMPPKGKRLSADEVAMLRAWIDQGAIWPDDADTNAKEQKLWSLEALVKPALPVAKDQTWCRTPIDAFILASLQRQGMSPAPPASPRNLIRRMYYDLIGLPPSPQEIDVFEQAFKRDAQAAINSLADQLLASPRYGERWARHWMDVVHFAETHGHDQDRPRPDAWPYRDYLIRAFNDDKPYARFIEDQVAGDVLHAEDPWATAALGMLAAGPWDESSQMGIQDNTQDKKIAQYLDRDDMIATTISTFSSVTISCARCHNHKFDPISTEDYYALQAVFAGVDRVNRPFEPDEGIKAKRKMLLARKVKLDAGELSQEELFSAANSAAVETWSKAMTSELSAWSVIEPTSVASANGSTLTRQSDGSYLASGDRPEKETYVFTTTTNLKKITAIRLEVLTDESLPHKGPGRQDNGNLHLSEFRVELKAPMADRKSDISDLKLLKLRAASADWDQEGWGVARAIDGKPETAWGIYPKVGTSHDAIFELETPANPQGETVTLVITLDQLHGGGHLIGRPRLSITDATKPGRSVALPQAIVATLKLLPEQRSDEQRKALALHVLRLSNDAELAKLPRPQMVYAVTNRFPVDGNFKPSAKPREVSVLRRGDITQPIVDAKPGSLSCISGGLPSRFALENPEDESSRRAALGKWLSHRDNVLTWRSIVNRMWHYHFGRGLVDTPNDLGHMGGKPSHPQLLDWLAVTFRDDMQGSLKQLHKLIVTSSVYQQSTQHNESFAAMDVDNHLLWRMNRQRLDAEQTRDTMLILSGKIDLTMYGPSVKQFIEKPGIHVTPIVDYANFDVDHPSQFRRSVYRFVFRTLPDPLMDALDCPDLSQLTPKRSVSITAQQSLQMLNNHFMVRQCEHIAARIETDCRSASNDEKLIDRQIARLYDLTLGREPTSMELSAVSAYATKHGLANAVRVVINSNEFLFLN